MSYHPLAGDVHAQVVIDAGTPDRALGFRRLDDVTVTMGDGVTLGADVYVPSGVERAPTVLIRQPYGRRTAEMGFAEVGEFFARKGYACVVQDVRGKFSSGGRFDPGVNEVADGYDTLDWVVAQPWSDGRVGCWGESYYGFTSYAAAVSGHPSLACIAPGDIGVDRRQSWFRQGAFQLNTTGYWALSMDSPEFGDVSEVDPYHLPLRDLPATVSVEGGFFRAMVDHCDDEVWWSGRGLEGEMARVQVPVLCWGGWYDNYLGPMLSDYAALRQSHPRPESVHLFVGPWDHEGSGDYTDRAACLRVPPTTQKRWATYQAFFDHYLMGVDNGFGEQAGVEIFVLGPNRWHQERSWPPPASSPLPLYLRAGGALSFAAPATDEDPDSFTYDPADPVPETVGRNCWALCTALDDRRRLDGRSDILRYAGEPLEADHLLVGPVSAVLYGASSAVDTDFTVTLCDVFPDGTVNTIQDGIVRARYRNGVSSPSPLEPATVQRYEVDLFATAYLVRRGHRLRVDVSSSNFDRYDRNLNTGEPFGTASHGVVAHQAVHHSAAHPSAVLLPVMARQVDADR